MPRPVPRLVETEKQSSRGRDDELYDSIEEGNDNGIGSGDPKYDEGHGHGSLSYPHCPQADGKQRCKRREEQDKHEIRKKERYD